MGYVALSVHLYFYSIEFEFSQKLVSLSVKHVADAGKKRRTKDEAGVIYGSRVYSNVVHCV